MDEDGSGSLDLGELKVALENPEINARLKMIDFPVDDPEKIFMLLDIDNVGELELDTFMKGCMRLAGDAMSKDLLEVLISVGNLGKRIHTLEEKIIMVQEKTTALDMKTARILKEAKQFFGDGVAHQNAMKKALGIDEKKGGKKDW